MDDEERAFRASMGLLVDWYRVEQTRSLWVAFLPAFVLLPLGSAIVALAQLQRFVPIALSPWITVLGVLVTASGPGWAITQLLRTIRRDLYVAIRSDGLCVRLDPLESERVYEWDSVLDAQYDASNEAICVSLRLAEPVSIKGRFAQLGLPELSRRIRDARRLAVWNRLKPRFDTDDARD
ncbi:MAG: hypothetical protein JWN04_3872 [Myxococcaceae bacterium]|nr:hypothetical protein [Myxococcaceae bacterium]